MDRELTMFVNAVQATVETQPDPRIAETLVPRLARTARAATIAAETQTTHTTRVRPRRRPRFALVARVGIAVALLPLLLAGMAVAGVTLPEPARSAFESVGIDLPNQPVDQSSSTAGGGEGKSEPASSDGKAKGQANAAQKKHHGKAKGHAKQHGNSSGSHGNSANAPGHTGSAGSQDPGNGNSSSHSGGSSSRTHPVHPPHPPAASRGRGNGHN